MVLSISTCSQPQCWTRSWLVVCGWSGILTSGPANAGGDVAHLVSTATAAPQMCLST